jgi:radical SAM protein with 4Fe4S-binding SPASM domain
MQGNPNRRRTLLGRLDVELTERCNNDCIHCCINLPENDPAASSRELTTTEWQDILRQAADLGMLKVRFTGGEPLLRGDFPDLYLYARRLGLRVLLFTNARLITPQIADLLAHIPPLERIEITVYGMSTRSYEAVTRVPGSYAQFREGVERLWERKVPFVIKGALLPANKHEIGAIEDWAAAIPWMESTTVPYAMFFDLRARRDSESRNRLIRNLRLTPEEGLAVLTRQSSAYRRGMTEFCSKFMKSSGDKLFPCGAGHGGCVDAYGNLQPCMSVRHPALVRSLKTVSLRDAIAEVSQVDGMRATNPEYLRRCARCFLKGLCEQCPGKSWSEHGTLDTPVEYQCQIAHAQARYLGLLAENELAWEVTDGQERVSKMTEGVNS